MNSKLVKSNKLYALFGAFALLALIPSAGFAAVTNVWILDVVTNYSGSDYPGGVDYLTRHDLIQGNARWGIGTNPTINVTGQNVPKPTGFYVINFLVMTNYYVPVSTSLNLTVDTTNTYLYVPYTNTLSVTVAGTSSNVIWSFSARPGELTNSTAYQTSYTNAGASTVSLTPIPTGTYTVVFPPVSGWIPPDPVTTNITGASPLVNSITGTYALSTYTLTVGFSPVGVMGLAKWQVDGNGTWLNNGASVSLSTNISHSIQYKAVPDYYAPPSEAITLTSDTTITRNYDPYTNSLSVVITGLAGGDSATWSIPLPLAFTNSSAYKTRYTNSQDISSIPTGSYTITFNSLTGYTNYPFTITTNITGSTPSVTVTGAYYLYGGTYNLKVFIGPPFARQATLPGLGAGSCRVAYNSSTVTQSLNGVMVSYPVPVNEMVTLTALTNYVYKWYRTTTGGTNDANIDKAQPFDTSYSFQMDGDYVVWLLYSTAYNSYDNAGDIDHDGLPDRWENKWWPGPNTIAERTTAPMAETNGNANANPDGDWIPSTLTNAPARISIETNVVSYFAADGSKNIGYPLYQGSTFLDPADGINEFPAGQFGYSKGVPFGNQLEARGLDKYYETNGPSGWVPNDDPYTDPTKFDTATGSATGISDGWKYYFWYWRADNGLSNSANLSWVGINPAEDPSPQDDTDDDWLSDLKEYTTTWTDPTHCDTDGDGMDDYWETTFCGGSSNALDSANWSLNPDEDYYATVSNRFVLTDGMAGTPFTNAVCYSGTAANPVGAWENVYTNTGSNVFDLYRDTIIKAAALTNRQTGGTYTNNTVYYGTNAGLAGGFQQGYPVWVDMNGNGRYDTNGDVAVVNPPIKHELVYCMAPTNPFPGVTSFDPRTAWNHTNDVLKQDHPNTQPYNNYQEYLGGDYLGRLSWDAGGQQMADNDKDGGKNILPRDRTAWTDPGKIDTDTDTIEDGWELYVGLNPNNDTDAALDKPPFGDDDKLVNRDEWANVYRGPYANTNATVGPSDPGVLVAPAPNDPHPRDTDWDGLGDALEKTGSNPTAWDTDGDVLPDGWEIYAGTSVTNADAAVDLDGDGLDNFQEYWTGTVAEWQNCDGAWGAYFMTRASMPWDAPKNTHLYQRVFIPPDFLTDGSFMFYNGVLTNVDLLRANYPATSAVGKYEENYKQYHTTLANNPDSDGDGMDDFWEVYHGLNPCKGTFDMMMPAPTPPSLRWSYLDDIDYVDADSGTPGFQFGIRPEAGGGVFNSLSNMVAFVNSYGSNRWIAIAAMIGPYNFGLQQMDPDGDGLPNLEEYSYSPNRTLYHTDPTPLWRTDHLDANSFVNLNYNWDSFHNFFPDAGLIHLYDPFEFEEKEGFDTDNDGVGDYAEINSAAGELGNNPLDERNPIRNRALYVNGTTDFVRTLASWVIGSESYLTRFCVEAWIKPDNPARAGDQVILEKAALYNNQYNPAVPIVGANFRLGITNGLPYVMYNGRGALRTWQATAQIYSLTPGVWAHIAGVYDGATLTLYVNGEFSRSVTTTELPVTGVNAAFSSAETNYMYNSSGHSMMIGARDLTCGRSVPTYDALSNSIPLTPASYFGGCIDEVRIWNGARSQAEVIANKNRRIPRSEMTNSPLVHYYSFDDVPDPLHRNSAGAQDEFVAPLGLTNLDTTMSFHPPITWWVAHPQRSTVYSGWLGAYNYLVSAADHAAHMSIWPPRDDAFHFSTNYAGTNVLSDYNNFSNPYEIPDYSTHGGYMRWYNPGINEDMVLFMGARGVTTNSWLGGLDPNNPDSTDTDGDGLPDWWEQLYGLDPNDATGDNGKWGDPDHDGLSNYAEYLAGTDPRNSDTYGTGIGDYDYPRGVYSRTYGEMYTAGDGMPADWKAQHGLDPMKYEANGDLDGDGWSNYAEYLAGTDPNNASSHPNPALGGVIRYPGTLTNGVVLIVGYQTNTMDGVPALTGKSGSGGAGIPASEVVGHGDGTTKVYSGQLQHGQIVKGSVGVSRRNNQFVAPPFDFQDDGNGSWKFFPNYTDSVDGNKYVQFDYITGAYTFTWPTGSPNTWNAPWNGDVITIDYQWQDVSADTFQVTGFKEGDAYLFAFRDLNGNGTWDAGEPAGVARNQPIYMDWKTPGDEVVIGLADTLPGYGRFNWSAASNTNDYNVVINRISESGAPQVVSRAMHWSRNYVHEWDYQIKDIYGLMAGTYQWRMGSQNGTFRVTWPASLAKPVLVYPRGDTLYYAHNDLVWTMDNNSTRYHLQMTRQVAVGSTVSVVDDYFTAPYLGKDGQYRDRFPYYAGELGNGIYYWRVAGWNPQAESTWSDWQTFNVNLSATNSCWISGDIYYFGKVPATKIIVEAYDNRGFSGWPVARMKLTPSATTGWAKCSYTLRGLKQGAYYVRAFLDVTPAGSTGPSGKWESWSSVGFCRDPNNFYQPGLVNLSDVQFVNNAKIIIRDKDADNDKLPDAWEMAYFGNLDQTGDMDYDGDGESNLQEYIMDGVNMNPASWDTDGDGLGDGVELRYNSAKTVVAALAARDKDGAPLLTSLPSSALNPTAWDTDGDGYSDGAELLRYHTKPQDPTSYPHYLTASRSQPLRTDAWPSPGDYDGDGRSDVGIYDSKAGVWCLYTMAGQSDALSFGVKGATPMVGDYTGDGHSEFTFYDKGLWTICAQNGASAAFQLGDASMLPAPADYTGDGRTDLAVFDTDSGIWYVQDIWSGAMMSGQFGSAGMIPVPGDYNGDGQADFVLYAPATGNWLLGMPHKYYKTFTVLSGTLGGPTWTPVPGDYDGDGRNDLCLFEANTGNWMLYNMTGQFAQGTFGWKGCVPVPGDYDGDGKTDIVLYDTNTGMWYILCMSGAYAEGRFGWPGALPIVKGRF